MKGAFFFLLSFSLVAGSIRGEESNVESSARDLNEANGRIVELTRQLEKAKAELRVLREELARLQELQKAVVPELQITRPLGGVTLPGEVLPEGWLRKEFNGRPVYTIPLGAAVPLSEQ